MQYLPLCVGPTHSGKYHRVYLQNETNIIPNGWHLSFLQTYLRLSDRTLHNCFKHCFSCNIYHYVTICCIVVNTTAFTFKMRLISTQTDDISDFYDIYTLLNIPCCCDCQCPCSPWHVSTTLTIDNIWVLVELNLCSNAALRYLSRE